MKRSLLFLVKSLMVIGYTSFLFWGVILLIEIKGLAGKVTLIILEVFIGVLLLTISHRYLTDRKVDNK